MADTRCVYGVNPVRELLATRPRTVEVVFVAAHATGAGLREIRERCGAVGVPVETRERHALDGMAGPGAVHQGVVAVAGAFAYADLDAMCDAVVARGEVPLLVVCDSVQDPGNLGAVLRSAHVLGAHGVVIPKDRAAPVTPAVVKAASGATEHVPVAQVVNVARALETLKRRGIWTVAAVADDGADPWTLDLRVPTALVLGAEGPGLRPLVARTCDFRARVPMTGAVGSLNVSVAAGVLLYEAARQRRAAAAP